MSGEKLSSEMDLRCVSTQEVDHYQDLSVSNTAENPKRKNQVFPEYCVNLIGGWQVLI